jgi:8-oxo-dGTP pyrophosphatase MutT (NUDIX family)
MLFGQASEPAGGELPVQTAALPWRCTKAGKFEFLLVTSRSSQRWIIPKGRPMVGKSLAEAATQEAYEEAGVRGKINEQSVGSFEHVKQSAVGGPVTVLVHVYPLAVNRELDTWPEKEQRSRRWFGQSEASKAIESEGLRSVVERFAQTLAKKRGKTLSEP